ncbi:MAG: hypothetical protein ACOCV2_01675 [Persicimonas sp.]
MGDSHDEVNVDGEVPEEKTTFERVKGFFASKVGLAVAIILLLSTCCFSIVDVDCKPFARNYEDGKMRLPVFSEQSWEVAGETYEVARVEVEKYKDGRPPVYVIGYRCSCKPSQMSSQELLREAWPLIFFAYENDLWRNKLPSGEREASHIKVEFVSEESDETSRSESVTKSIDEIEDIAE